MVQVKGLPPFLSMYVLHTTATQPFTDTVNHVWWATDIASDSTAVGRQGGDMGGYVSLIYATLDWGEIYREPE